MPWIVGGQTNWDGGQDADGHRTYRLYLQTQGTLLDGPAAHLQTPGLPLEGAVWAYDNDLDVFAWYTGERSVKGRGTPPCEFFDHVYTFTTRRDRRGADGGKKDDRGARKKCADQRIEDPLAEPPKITWSGTANQREMTEDRNGVRLRTTSFEQLSGPLVTFDESGERVTIVQNLIDPQRALLRQMADTLNESPLWDLPARCWKYMHAQTTIERQLYGTCGFYFTRTLNFEARIRFDNDTSSYVGAWDKLAPDLSSSALNGRWSDDVPGEARKWIVENFKNGQSPVFSKPNHYVPIPNPRGAGYVQRILSRTSLGTPALTEDDENWLTIEYYGESDFFELGVPPYLE